MKRHSPHDSSENGENEKNCPKHLMAKMIDQLVQLGDSWPKKEMESELIIVAGRSVVLSIEEWTG